MNYSSVTDLFFATEDKKYLGCKVTFELAGTVSYIAYQDDVEQHSREIYQRAIKGDFGPIADYVSPAGIVSTEEILKSEIRFQRDQKLQQLDRIVCNPLRWESFSNQIKTKIADYRQSLLDVPQQNGFPQNVVWPIVPDVITDAQLVISAIKE